MDDDVSQLPILFVNGGLGGGGELRGVSEVTRPDVSLEPTFDRYQSSGSSA